MSAVTEAGPPPGAGLPPVDLAPKRRLGESIVKALLLAAAVISIAITFGIVAALLEPTIEFFAEIPAGDFFSFDDQAEYSVGPFLMGTLVTTVIALLVAVPIGLGAAMYLSEYASPRARRILKPTVELLAGVPSVVYGFFAVFFLSKTVFKEWLNWESLGLLNALSAGIILGVMIIPTVASLAEDALSAVPQAMRQGSLAMGANRMQTTLRVVLPAALSGVMAAIILGLSRAVGETMIVTIAAGSLKNSSINPTESMQTMTSFMAIKAGGEDPAGTPGYNMLFAVGMLLFVITLIINFISISIVRRYRQAY